MLDCKKVTELASNYIDGAVPLILRIRLKFHLFICRCCRNYSQQIRHSISTVSILKPKEKDDTDKTALAMKLHDHAYK